MSTNFNRFHKQIDKYSKEFAAFEPFKGDITKVIPIESLYEREATSALIKEMIDGNQYKTAHMTTKHKLQEIGMNAEQEFYISAEKSSLTTPVLIPL